MAVLGTILYIIGILNLVSICDCRLDPKIVGGHESNIKDFSYAAALKIKCVRYNGETDYVSCGSAIINQDIVLTAAHCTVKCTGRGSFITAYVGHNNKRGGTSYPAHSAASHQGYDEFLIENDISIVRLEKSLKFSSKVGRVALVRNPPSDKEAMLAGWGWINEYKRIQGEKLKSVVQYTWKKKKCDKKLGYLPKGTFCATSGSDNEYPSVGDSGSPLVIRGYLQIGIVSYKEPQKSMSVIIYTDVGYFYDWIKNTVDMICSNNLRGVIIF